MGYCTNKLKCANNINVDNTWVCTASALNGAGIQLSVPIIMIAEEVLRVSDSSTQVIKSPTITQKSCGLRGEVKEKNNNYTMTSPR